MKRVSKKPYVSACSCWASKSPGCTRLLWRGGLPPRGYEVAPKTSQRDPPARARWLFYDGFAAERGGAAFRQAPSPQKPSTKSPQYCAHELPPPRPDVVAFACRSAFGRHL
ncbi:hypothetical protein C1884_07450 [Pseudomonas sp. GW460-R15]|nr:hypothetical protein C1887_20935 [Pseudomonas sp. GW456-R21]POA69208.1 hypothetical protein C1884_07450 [Pseudomonas sp. GW460-R15]